VLHTFVYSRVAVLVRHWFEVGLDDGVLEHGARLELRRLEPQPHRGTESAAQRIVIDRPVWRADLFDRLDRPAGSFSAAHFHPRFDGDEPCDRVWRPEIKADPWAWATAALSDVAAVAAAGGVPPGEVDADADDIRDEASSIIDSARSLAPLPGAVPSVDPGRRRHGADHGAEHGRPRLARPGGRRPLAGRRPSPMKRRVHFGLLDR
jgi:hypothetical protein